MTETLRVLLSSPVVAAAFVLFSVVITAIVTTRVASANRLQTARDTSDRLRHERAEADLAIQAAALEAARERLFEKRYDALMNAADVLRRGLSATTRPGTLGSDGVLPWVELDHFVTQLTVLTDDEIALHFASSWYSARAAHIQSVFNERIDAEDSNRRRDALQVMIDEAEREQRSFHVLARGYLAQQESRAELVPKQLP